MAYRFKLDNNAGKGFRRIAREQISLAIAELKSSAVPVPGAIHASRKALKRLRALLACVEPAIGAKSAKRHDRTLRDIARALSARRDADVSLDTLGALEAHYGEEARRVLAPLRGHLEQVRDQTVSGLDEGSIEEICGRLEKVSKTLEKQDWKGKSFALVLCGIGTTYRAGRVALAKAFKSPTDERMHRFRKLVQAHWRHMGLLSRAWPEAFAVRMAAAHDLSQLLGEDHDLAMMKLAAAALDGREKRDVVKLCARRQKELRALAEPLSRRLFVETEREFSRRMSAYWKLAEKIRAGEKLRGKDPANPPQQIGSPQRIAAKTPV